LGLITIKSLKNNLQAFSQAGGFINTNLKDFQENGIQQKDARLNAILQNDAHLKDIHMNGYITKHAVE
jgi:hypothetical protein